MLIRMTNTPLFNLHALARTLGLSAAWLKAEANAGRIPCLKVGRRLLFNPVAVERALAERAAGERAGAKGVDREH
jgi:hypothetical protein